MATLREQEQDKWTVGMVISEIVDILTSPMPWVVVGGFAFVIVQGMASYEEQEKENLIRQAPGAAFALDNMRECLATRSWLRRGETTATCINNTVAAARTLRGEPFAEQVRTVLADQYAPSHSRQH